MDDQYTQMGQMLLAGQTDPLKQAVTAALEKGTAATEILEKGMMPAMEALGKRFSAGDAFLPELLLAGDTMTHLLDVLRPAFASAGTAPIGKMIIGTVAGDIHDLGKNIVKMMFEGAGFEVIDVGTNISADAFTEAYKTHSPQLVGLSTLLTSTMTAMGQIIAQVRETFPDAKFIVGGAPVTQEFADSIKADGYAPDAHSAVSVGRQLIDN